MRSARLSLSPSLPGIPCCKISDFVSLTYVFSSFSSEKITSSSRSTKMTPHGARRLRACILKECVVMTNMYYYWRTIERVGEILTYTFLETRNQTDLFQIRAMQTHKERNRSIHDTDHGRRKKGNVCTLPSKRIQK